MITSPCNLYLFVALGADTEFYHVERYYYLVIVLSLIYYFLLHQLILARIFNVNPKIVLMLSTFGNAFDISDTLHFYETKNIKALVSSILMRGKFL